MKDDVWPNVANFGVGWFLFWLAVLGAVIALNGCASAPQPLPTLESEIYRACAEACPGGDAFIVENARDVACYCRKSPEGT